MKIEPALAPLAAWTTSTPSAQERGLLTATVRARLVRRYYRDRLNISLFTRLVQRRRGSLSRTSCGLFSPLFNFFIGS